MIFVSYRLNTFSTFTKTLGLHFYSLYNIHFLLPFLFSNIKFYCVVESVLFALKVYVDSVFEL